MPLFPQCLAFGFAALLCAAPNAYAAGNVTIEQVVVGLDGYYKVGEWAPVRVSVMVGRSVKAALVITCVDADENATEISTVPDEVVPGRTWLEGRFKTGRLRNDLQVRVVDSAGRLLAESRLAGGKVRDSARWTWKDPLRMDAALWVALGDPAGIESAAESHGSSARIVAQLATADQLPRDALALSGVDAMILAADPDLLRKIDARRNAALRDWVLHGGRLLIAAGGRSLRKTDGDFAPPFFKPEPSQRSLPVADWCPIVATGRTEVRQLSGLEAYVSQPTPLRFSGTLESPRLADVADGTVLVSGAFGPLLVRAPYGFGQINFLGLDVTTAPLSKWTALPRLYEKVLGSRGSLRESGNRQPSQQGRLSRGGVSDLATQLHQAQDEFPAIRPTSYWQAMGLLLLALTIVGPLDYAVVTLWLKRPAWTWVTLPAWVILGVIGLYSLGLSGGGSRPLYNELDLVDIDAATGIVRGRSWLTVYSPTSRRFDLAVEPSTPREFESGLRPFRKLPEQPRVAVKTATSLSWSSPPEESLGGVYRAGGVNLTIRNYRFDSAAASALDVPIPLRSTKAFTVEWSRGTSVDLENALERTSLGRISGTLSHRLPGTLEQCLLVHAGLVYFPAGSSGRLNPGQIWRPANPRGLKPYLTNAKTTQIFQRNTRTEQYITTAEPYDPFDHERNALVRMLSFHQAADGSKYTGLAHAALGRLELSTLLDLDRAVLVARFQAAPLKWTVNGVPMEPTQRDTFVRIVLPVSRGIAQDASDRPFVGDR